MTFFIRWPGLICTLLLWAFVPCEGSEPRRIVPDADIQAQLRRYANSQDGGTPAVEFEKLRRMDKEPYPRLIPQIVWFTAHAKREVELLSGEVSLSALDVPPHFILEALLPFSGSDDAKVNKEIRHILGGIESSQPHREPCYDLYESHIQLARKNKKDVPVAFLKYMFERDPGKALGVMVRTHLRDDPDRREIIWGEHIVAENFWKRTNEFLEPKEVEPEARKELNNLIHNKQWWVRLYVAAILRQHPEFQTPAMVQRLKDDSHSLVRETAAQIGKTPNR